MSGTRDLDEIRQQSGDLHHQAYKESSITPLRYVDYIAAFPFRFLDLPGEIRNKIYELVLPYNENSRPAKHRTALLRACRQTHEEGAPIFYLLSSMTLKVSVSRDNYVEQAPLTFRCTFDGDIQLRERTTMNLYTCLYKCNELAGLKNIRNITIVVVKTLHLGSEAWLAFFTYFAQAACRLRRLRIQQRSTDDWWHKDPDKVASTLSPLRKCIPYGCLVYLEGFVIASYKAVIKRLGLHNVNDSGVKLFRVWNAMLSKYEWVPRQCLSSE